MKTVTVTCLNNDRTAEAEVLEHNDKYLSVVFADIKVVLRKIKPNIEVYSGTAHGLSFECDLGKK